MQELMRKMKQMNLKRMHPLKIIQSLFSLIKNSAIIIIYLFILRLNDSSMIPKFGRIIFLLFFTYQIVSILIDWWKTTYEINSQFIHIYRGLWKRRHNRVSLSIVQNVRRITPFYYKPFGVTSLHLETSATDTRATVTFEAITIAEAIRIENELERARSSSGQSIAEEKSKSPEKIKTEKGRESHTQAKERTIHFQPTRQELIKASFLSLSFLVVIPIVISIYENVEDFIPLEDTAMSIFQTIKGSWVLIVLTFGLLAIILVGSGVLRTFLKYGKYEISSDQNYIFIRMGILSERFFSIHKGNVQAIQLIETPMKQWLGLCEVKLISAESIEEETTDISTLYPYMDKDRAFHLIQELLPNFPIQHQMHRLPKKALTMKMIRIPWLLIIITSIILIFKRTWWYVLPVLLIITYVMRYFDYRNTRYAIANGNIQFVKGGVWRSWFITNRKKVIEVEVTKSYWQQRLGLATIHTINQTKPVHYMDLEDVPFKVSEDFIYWYGNRVKEITKIDNEGDY